MGRFGWVAGAALVAMSAAANAAPIEYKFTGSVTGATQSGQGVVTNFNDATATIIGIGDTSSFTLNSGTYYGHLSSLTLSISGIGTLTESNPSYFSLINRSTLPRSVMQPTVISSRF